MDICMIIGHILFLAGIIFSIITIIKSINSSDKPETYFVIACICFICSMFLLAMSFCQETEEIETEVRSIITENYEECTFADDNTFYWHGKLYEYELNEDETQVTVKRRESETYDLKK